MCSSKKKLTTEEFIKNAKKAHGNKYDYSLVDYKNSKTNVTLICHKKDEFGNEHGPFEINPHQHCTRRLYLSKVS